MGRSAAWAPATTTSRAAELSSKLFVSLMTCFPQDATHKVHGNVKKRFGSPTIDSANLQLSAPASNLILEDFRRQACFGAGVAPAQQREAAFWPAALTAFHGLPSCLNALIGL